MPRERAHDDIAQSAPRKPLREAQLAVIHLWMTRSVLGLALAALR